MKNPDEVHATLVFAARFLSAASRNPDHTANFAASAYHLCPPGALPTLLSQAADVLTSAANTPRAVNAIAHFFGPPHTPQH